ncbi:MAG: hypothetical protein DMG31_13235 [Acidobacteria bacterium]|nr:MAG: hypothetical protein DMG31_13235 [Acidobacteriota bacterium]
MTTVQEPPTDAIPPFPFFIENPAELNHTDLPTNSSRESHGNQELSRVNNVRPETSPNPLPERCQFDHPIRMVVPSAGESHLQDELSPVNKVQRERGTSPELRGDHGFIDTNPLPERCQFFFSDGRQCRMARSEIHPSRCPFHAEREDQLFGDPAPGGNVVGAALDLPELFSACRDLTTAAGVNRALAQVFRLLAQRRISRQEAATFGHLAQLLLRTISAARAESADPIRSSGESHQRDELSPVNKVVPREQREPRDLSVPTPLNKAQSPPNGRPHEPAGPSEGPAAPPPLTSFDATSGAAGAAPAPQKANATAFPDVASTFSRPANVAHAASPPNSQLSQNEQMRRTRLQLTQNEHLQNLDT